MICFGVMPSASSTRMAAPAARHSSSFSLLSAGAEEE